MEFSSIWSFASFVANIVLPLLVIFQWYKSHARDQAAKNALLGARRMVSRIHDPGAQDVLDALDATLATLGARRPFRDAVQRRIDWVVSLFKKEDAKPLLTFPEKLNEPLVEDEVEQHSKKRQKS